jgi:transcriptional regulator with XRE-family HTH domain
MPKRRVRFAEHRKSMGFTQGTLASALGLHVSSVYRWEQGTLSPTAIHRPDLAKALRITPEQLTELLGPEPTAPLPPADYSQIPPTSRNVVSEFTPSDRTPIDPASVVDPPWTVTGALQVLHTLSGGSVDRRDFLTITGGALTGLANHWGTALASAPPSMASPEVHGSRLSPEVLHRLGRRLAELRRLDDALGGRDLCQLADAEFRYLTHLADHATYDAATGQRLFGLITDAAGLCGWLHDDAARRSAAQYYYVAALRSSTIANDPLAGAHILGRWAQARMTGHPQDSVEMLEAAEHQVKGVATPRARARIAKGKALAYAQAGYAYACGKSLNDAERWLDKARPGTDEPDWLYYINEAELAYTAAACWVELRKPKKARPLIDNAMRHIEPEYIRDRAVYHVRSAEAHAHANDLEPACDDLRAAADLVRRTGSVRTIELIRTARRLMSPHDKEPRVQDLDRHLATLTT